MRIALLLQNIKIMKHIKAMTHKQTLGCGWQLINQAEQHSQSSTVWYHPLVEPRAHTAEPQTAEPQRGSSEAKHHLIGADHILAVLADLFRLLLGLGEFGCGLPQLVFRLLRRRGENTQ